MKIENGLLHSPYFIFLEERLPDHALLRLLGFENYVCVPLVDPGRREREVCITEDPAWVHVADDWWYTLWHKGMPIIERLHRQNPEATTFACSVGDSDDSFGFALYASGQLQRRLEVDDPHFDRKRRTVRVDIGRPLAIEDEELTNGEPWAYVKHLAKQMGVIFDHQAATTRCYASPKKGERLKYQ